MCDMELSLILSIKIITIIFKLLYNTFFLSIHQAVVIDMEEGVVNEILKGPLRDVFDCQQLITDVSGSGNNW